MNSRGATSALIALTAAVGLVGPAVDPTGAADPAVEPAVITCAQAGDRVVISDERVLDPSCTYTGGFELTASGASLDCRGAVVSGPVDGPFGSGILVHAPSDTALRDVTIRNCRVQGFGNGIRVTRDGFRSLPPGAEYDHTFERIVIEDTEVRDTRGVGIFVDGYVAGVTIRRVLVTGAGSSGVYLEAGSRDNVVRDSRIIANGFRENGAQGSLNVIDGVPIRAWGPGREGISIDASRGNVITGNEIRGNSAGGIFLYKNCGEFWKTRPERWFERRFGANGNRIEGNEIAEARYGVWLGARMAENTWPMECSAPAYHEAPFERFVLDEATDNVVAGNVFREVVYGVRVEDDRNVVEGNRFEGSDAGQWAVIVGTRERTARLARPVRASVIRSNDAWISGNPSPFRWVDGEQDSIVEGNTTGGRPTGWCQAPSVPSNPFVMVVAFAIEPPGGPPAPTPDLTVATLEAQPACPGGSPADDVSVPVDERLPAALRAAPRFAG